MTDLNDHPNKYRQNHELNFPILMSPCFSESMLSIICIFFFSRGEIFLFTQEASGARKAIARPFRHPAGACAEGQEEGVATLLQDSHSLDKSRPAPGWHPKLLSGRNCLPITLTISALLARAGPKPIPYSVFCCHPPRPSPPIWWKIPERSLWKLCPYDQNVASEIRHHCNGWEDGLYSHGTLSLRFLVGSELNFYCSSKLYALYSGGQAGWDLGTSAVQQRTENALIDLFAEHCFFYLGCTTRRHFQYRAAQACAVDEFSAQPCHGGSGLAQDVVPNVVHSQGENSGFRSSRSGPA